MLVGGMLLGFAAPVVTKVLTEQKASVTEPTRWVLDIANLFAQNVGMGLGAAAVVLVLDLGFHALLLKMGRPVAALWFWLATLALILANLAIVAVLVLGFVEQKWLPVTPLAPPEPAPVEQPAVEPAAGATGETVEATAPTNAVPDSPAEP
jgi:hypothetical protein